jgi:hypothetical protein
MSFDEYDDCFVWRCDRCGHCAEFPPGDFWRALRELKSRGWLIERDDDGWSHTCKRCRKSSAELLSMPVKRTERGR